MSFFPFDTKAPAQDPHYAGSVTAVGSRTVTLDVSDAALERIGVGKLATLPGGERDTWLIGFIDRIVCEPEHHVVTLTLIGMVYPSPGFARPYVFTRALRLLPAARASCFVLRDATLTAFMGLLADAGDTQHALLIGHYALDPSAAAYLDGNRFFQRHAALLGSTGSGKSWTVATILERAARLPSANLIVFDLHGEYSRLSYARQLRVPGPDDLHAPQPDHLFLPYWLMNAEELVSLFVDRSEPTANDQTLVLQREVEQAKRTFLEEQGKKEVLGAFTVDSPVPFSLDTVIDRMDEMNTKVIQGTRGPKQGDFFGEFNRLLVRIETRRTDKRYGFLFQAPKHLQTYNALDTLAAQLLDFTAPQSKVKIIDFSEVPADVLPVMLGIVARLIYAIQFWMPAATRHPVALVCDEAHLYLPQESTNPNLDRAIACFQKVAKEGRKYGVSLVVVSQRPSEVNATILSQCNNVLALRLTNAHDQTAVTRLVPECLGSLLDMLPILDTGEALAIGDAVLLPTRIRINPPSEPPVSTTIDFWTEWQKVNGQPDWQLAAENMRRQRRRSKHEA